MKMLGKRVQVLKRAENLSTSLTELMDAAARAV
jgi:hypothetical protein